MVVMPALENATRQIFDEMSSVPHAPPFFSGATQMGLAESPPELPPAATSGAATEP
jgi:hypothetical protein